MFEEPVKLLLGLITGIVFGFLLQKGQVAKFQAILGQLLLKDLTVLKIMATAIAVGAIGVQVHLRHRAAHLDRFLASGSRSSGYVRARVSQPLVKGGAMR